MSRRPVFDGHVDLLHHLREHHPGAPFAKVRDGPLTMQRLQQGKVRAFLSAYFLSDDNNGPGAGLALERAVAYLKEQAPEIAAARRPADLRKAMASDQGPPVAVNLLENADALLEYDLDRFADERFKVVGLTHFGRNRLAAGDQADPAFGLTEAGRDLLARMERRGLILDTAHLNETSFFQALEHFRGPVLCSHTGLRRFHDTPRNLSGEQVAALMERGAVVGVTVAPEILAADRSAGLEEAVRSIDWIVQRFGPEGVGLGSDYGGFDTPSRGLEHPGLLDRLGAALDGLGYPEEAVAGIMGGAWLRFFEANWPGA